ncbi:MAG: molybdopterin-guanine dinucleotide biosynthesis protein MobB [Bilophila sp.]
MQAIGIVGYSNSGKTTLISRLSECLEARGLRVAIAKHTHHPLDKPDTDTALLMRPGRTIVALSHTKDGGEAMIHWGHPCFLKDIVPLLDADVLLVEGGKTLCWLPRILCLRPTPELQTALPAGLKELKPELAVASYGEIQFAGLKSFTAETLDALVDVLLERAFLLPGLDCGACGEKDCAGLAERTVKGEATPAACVVASGAPVKAVQSVAVEVDGQDMALPPHVAPALWGTLCALCAPLKGVPTGSEVVLRIKR